MTPLEITVQEQERLIDELNGTIVDLRLRVEAIERQLVRVLPKAPANLTPKLPTNLVPRVDLSPASLGAHVKRLGDTT